MSGASALRLVVADLDETLVHAREEALDAPHIAKVGPYYVYADLTPVAFSNTRRQAERVLKMIQAVEEWSSQRAVARVIGVSRTSRGAL